MSKITINRKYQIYGLVMLVLALLELYLPYNNMSLNVVFYGIAFTRIIVCRCMEAAFAGEVKRGLDYKYCRIIFAILTYLYLIIFIFDVQSSFTLTRSEKNVDVAYKFFICTWILTFVLGVIAICFFIHADYKKTKTCWIIVNAILLLIIIKLYSDTLTTYPVSGKYVMILFLITRTVFWYKIVSSDMNGSYRLGTREKCSDPKEEN